MRHVLAFLLLASTAHADPASGIGRYLDSLAPPEAPAASASRLAAVRQGGYPVRNRRTHPYWTMGGQYPTWEHMTRGEHAGKFDPQWLQQLTWDELQSLHADDHEGRLQVAFVQRPTGRWVRQKVCHGNWCEYKMVWVPNTSTVRRTNSATQTPGIKNGYVAPPQRSILSPGPINRLRFMPSAKGSVLR